MVLLKFSLFYVTVCSFTLLPLSLPRFDPTHSGTRPAKAQVRILVIHKSSLDFLVRISSCFTKTIDHFLSGVAENLKSCRVSKRTL